MLQTARDPRLFLESFREFPELALIDQQEKVVASGRLVNVSRRGMFMASTDPVPEGQGLKFRLNINGQPYPVEGVGKVQWTQNKSSAILPEGIGLRIEEFYADGQELYQDFLLEHFRELKSQTLMIACEPHVISPATTMAEAMKKLSTLGDKVLVIVDQNGGPLGILGEKQISAAMINGSFHPAKPALGISSQDFTAVDCSATLASIANLLSRSPHGYLPVVTNHQLVGIIPTQEVLAFWAEMVELQRLKDRANYQRAVGVVAHDLRSPITFIMGACELLGQSSPQDLSSFFTADFPRLMKDSAHSLLQLTESLLTYVSHDRGVLQFAMAPLDIKGLLSDCIKRFNLQSELRKISIELVAKGSLKPITGDALRLEQVFNNILGNSLKHSSHGDKISVCISQNGSETNIQITDHGPGISSENLPKLFQEFGRLKCDNDGIIRQGTGLGLYISRRIIEAHHGKVKVTSKPGHGTTFLITLPSTFTGPKPLAKEES